MYIKYLFDESDAFRHFVWAALLTKELGSEKAKIFLDAHENDPPQPENELNMDSFNNNHGQLASEELLKTKSWSLRQIEKMGNNDS